MSFCSKTFCSVGESSRKVPSCVAGIADAYRGETVKAYIVLHEGSFASEDELRAFCAYKLVAYKVPTQFEFRTELPKNILGKVLRRVLRTEHEEAHARLAAASVTVDPLSDVESDAVSDIAIDTAVAGGVTAEDVIETTVLPNVAAPADELRADPAPDERARPHAMASGGFIDALERLVRLHSLGELSDDEFHAAKARLLR